MSADDSDSDGPYSLMMTVSSLIRRDKCQRCLQGKAVVLEVLVAQVRRLSRLEKRMCIITALSILYVIPEARPSRVRSRGERVRFHHYLPFVGRVCKTAFLNGFDVSAPTVARYRRMIKNNAVHDEYEDEL